LKSRFGLVFFDVDSTLVDFEGIDFLAGGDPRIVELTRQAMEGEIALEEVYGKRLEIVRPKREQLDALGARYVEHLLPDARETVNVLREAGIDVHLLSAGLLPAVREVGKALGLAERAIHAVGVDFDGEGAYRDFDRRSPLTRAGGKELVIMNLRSRAKGKVALVGDGASDLEAKPAVDLFIGFGGVVTREPVRAGADAFIDVPRLSRVIDLLEDRP
jgi:phosphoserine phosphatase